MRVSIIIPTLNEAQNLPHVLPRIPRLSEICEVLVVDGYSTDGTVEVARSLRRDVRVIYQDGRGKCMAVLTGARAALGDWVLVLDADGSHRPEEIPLYVRKAAEGYDLVKGSRYMPGGSTEDNSWHRWLLTFLTYSVANVLWGTAFTDIGYGMFLVNREKFLALGLRSRRMEMEYEMMIKAARAGLRIVEVPAVEERRRSGKSHLSYMTDGWLILATVVGEWARGVRAR